MRKTAVVAALAIALLAAGADESTSIEDFRHGLVAPAEDRAKDLKISWTARSESDDPERTFSVCVVMDVWSQDRGQYEWVQTKWFDHPAGLRGRIEWDESWSLGGWPRRDYRTTIQVWPESSRASRQRRKDGLPPLTSRVFKFTDGIK